MSNTASIINQDSITFYFNSKMNHVVSSNINFGSIKKAILENRFEDIEVLLNPYSVIEKKTNGILRVVDNDVFYKEDKLPTSLASRLVEIIQSGVSNITSYLKFLENTYNNPSSNSREQLYKFIEHKEMPITDDGCILAWKGVSSDYLDKHSGKFSNKIGTVNEMPRRDVDDNPTNHCSKGFHVGSKNYADSWAGDDGKLMIVKYDPADAVSVPSDHNFEKLRVSKYTVIAEAERDITDLNGKVYSESDTGLLEQRGTMDDSNLSYSDEWYKARNYIESARDNGQESIDNSELDELFSSSTWMSEDWEDLMAETECFSNAFHVYLNQ
jgi:hypothetical protein